MIYRHALLAAVVTSLTLHATADFARVQPQSEGKSAINADTVDGLDASDLGGENNLSEVLMLGNKAGDYNINMSDNAINNIGKLQDCGQNEFVNGAGECTTDSFASNTDNQDLQDVLAQDSSAGAYSINLNGNAINTGGGTVTINDSMNDQDIARFKEGGNVEIPNGNLDIYTNRLEVDPAGGSIRFNSDDSPSSLIEVDESGSDRWRLKYGNENLKWRDTNGSNQDVLRLNDGGNVKIPNGNLNMSYNEVTDVSRLNVGQLEFKGTNLTTVEGGTGEVQCAGNACTTSVTGTSICMGDAC